MATFCKDTNEAGKKFPHDCSAGGSVRASNTRDSHQNNLQKQSNCKETVPRWRGAVIASVPVQVESTKKNRTSWHYSELGKEALQEKQAKNGKILKNLTWKPWYLICWVSDKKCCRLPAVSYQHAISFRSSSCPQLPCSGIGRVTGGHVLFTLRSPQAYSVVTTSCHLCCDIAWRRPTRQVHVQREINERSTQLIYRKCIWCKGPEWRKIWQCPLNEDRSRPWPLFIYLFIFTKGKKKKNKQTPVQLSCSPTLNMPTLFLSSRKGYPSCFISTPKHQLHLFIYICF